MKLRVGLALIALAAVACSSASGLDDAGSVVRDPTADSVTEELIPTGQRRSAPSFEVTTTTGQRFSPADAAGTPFAMVFLAQGCASCVYMVEQLAAAQARLEGAAPLILLDLTNTDNEQVDAYYRCGLGGGHHLYAADEGLTVAQAYEVKLLGQSIVVDAAGRIAYEAADPSANELVSILQSLQPATATPVALGGAGTSTPPPCVEPQPLQTRRLP